MNTITELKFEGVDVSLEISLFEYGFICAPCKLNEYFVVYNNGVCFHTAIIQPKELNRLVTGNGWMSEKDITRFLSYCDCKDADEFIAMNFANRLQSLVSYYGWENIAGSTWNDGITEEEVRERYL